MLHWHKSSKRIFLPAARLLLVAGLISALFILGFEIFYRLKAPYRALGGAQELQQFRRGSPDHLSGFMLDPDFGFRPVFGRGGYTRFGTLENGYSEAKPEGITRLLFIGDSVTRRAQILEALRTRYRSQPYEYWNAGVESFNTVQEVAYYRSFNRFIRPDHVILTFHLNDFETTPVAFREADGTLVVYAPNWPVRRLNSWLFRHSYTYRYRLGLVSPRKTARAEIIEEVHANLADLQRLVAADKARLTVLVLPILRPFREWKPEYKEYRQLILAMLESLRIRHFDLLLPLNEALADGVVASETGDDLFWHPSPEVAAYFAAYLHRQKLLEGEDTP